MGILVAVDGGRRATTRKLAGLVVGRASGRCQGCGGCPRDGRLGTTRRLFGGRGTAARGVEGFFGTVNAACGVLVDGQIFVGVRVAFYSVLEVARDDALRCRTDSIRATSVIDG